MQKLKTQIKAVTVTVRDCDNEIHEFHAKHDAEPIHVSLTKGVTMPVARSVKPDGFDIGEVPSRLFDGLYFLMFRGTVRYGDVMAEKCPPLQFRLLWYLDCFDGSADLENAAIECWGKKVGENITLKSVRNNFYVIDDIFLELSLNASMAVSSTTARINR